MYDGIKDLFENFGYYVIWFDNKAILEDKIRNHKIEFALEWQHGRHDYTILNLVRKYYADVPVLLMLNWNGEPPDNFDDLDYVNTLSPVVNVDEVKEKFYRYCHHS